jgi:hypothetical protein
MRLIAVIDDPRVVERILRHLGAGHDPPGVSPPPGLSGPYTCEPCEDVGPTTKTCSRTDDHRRGATPERLGYASVAPTPPRALPHCLPSVPSCALSSGIAA